MFSQTVEYALRAVLFLAANPDTPMTARDVAAKIEAPTHYLSKVMQELARAEIIVSQRGPRGGFRLARPPVQITMLDIVEAIDPLQRVRRCPLGIESHGDLCPLHRRIDDAVATVEASLRASTMAELLGPSGTSAPLCENGANK